MTDPWTKTQYRVSQHWRFRNDTPEVRDTFVITSVEDHPTQGIVCAVQVTYDPPFQISRNTFTGGGNFWFTQAALDASVTEKVAERGPFPRHWGSRGEFTLEAECWGQYTLPDNRTVGQVVREAIAQLVRQRDEEANRPPYVPPPEASLGLWSLIAHDKADRFRALLEEHPSLANDPLARDGSDNYCYSDEEEYQECYPLMLAAELSSVEVAKVLLEFGADVRKRNNRGETALHFSGKANDVGCGANEIAQMLCERGADPNAENYKGKTPLTCYCSTNEVAEVLVKFGAKLNVNHALRLGELDWVRQQLSENPDIVLEAAYPEHIIDDVVHMMSSISRSRTGSWNYDDLSGWYRAAEVEKQVFEEHRDILEQVVDRGANLNCGSALFYAVQNFDTSLAAWLLARGADPNRDLKHHQASYMPDVARTRRMINLLKQYGAVENPYPHELDQWEQYTQSLRDQFV